MILLPPLNLFFYNIVLGFLECQYKRTMDGSLPEKSIWHKMPIIRDYIDFPEPFFPTPIYILPDLNPYVNALILLPAVFKHKILKVVLAVVLMWNMMICKRVSVYLVQLLVTLWASDFNSTHFVAILIFGITMILAHLVLMYYTAKLPVGQLLTWRRNR